MNEMLRLLVPVKLRDGVMAERISVKMGFMA